LTSKNTASSPVLVAELLRTAPWACCDSNAMAWPLSSSLQKFLRLCRDGEQVMDFRGNRGGEPRT
jgi:hypothetical protein